MRKEITFIEFACLFLALYSLFVLGSYAMYFYFFGVELITVTYAFINYKKL